MRQLKFQELIRKNIINIPGWNTKRKIVVFESNDWGSIRMSSIDVYNHFCHTEFRLTNITLPKMIVLKAMMI